jgi:2-keto-4-pentenoate hydratase/2-oxohepta-3-ene-1,7-dioic acid hydratase in catechol pathway
VAIADIPDLDHNFFKVPRPAIAFVKYSIRALTQNNTGELPPKRWTVGAEPQLCVFIGEMMGMTRTQIQSA